MMERQVGHMVHLINDLLDIARVSSGKLVLQVQPVDLRDVIATAVETSRPLIDAAGHGLSVDLPATAVPVDADPVRISQVVEQPAVECGQVHAAGRAYRAGSAP